MRLFQESQAKSYIVEHPTRIWILHSLANGDVKVEIISDEAEISKSVERVNALKLMLALEEPQICDDSSAAANDLEDHFDSASSENENEDQDTDLENTLWEVEVVGDWNERIKDYSPR